MDLNKLKTLLDGEFAGQTNAQVVEAMNARTLSRLVLIEKFKVNNYISNNNIIPRLRILVAQPSSPQLDTEIPGTGGLTMRMVALAGIDFPITDTGPKIDPNNQNTKDLIQVLQSAGLLSQELVDGFWELFREYYSRAESELGGLITEQDCRVARLLDKRLQVLAHIDAETIVANQIAQNLGMWRQVLAQLDVGIDVPIEVQ